MITVQILGSIGLLICASSSVPQEADLLEGHSNEAVDEIVVVGAAGCGSWPIEHQGLSGCVYAELKKKDLPTVLRSRQIFFSDCLNCLESRCTMKAWPQDRARENRFCKRLFRTPTRVPRFMKTDAHVIPLRVAYTFSISMKGRVQDIELISFDGDIEKEKLLQLIRAGAARTRFEPIVVSDVAYELIGLEDTFILDD